MLPEALSLPLPGARRPLYPNRRQDHIVSTNSYDVGASDTALRLIVTDSNSMTTRRSSEQPG
jgi:hypothetical protein